MGELPPAIDRLCSPGPSPDEETARGEANVRASAAVHTAVETLDEREQMIVRERFMKEDPPTLQELGVRLGVSKERVRQLEERARTKLRGELAELRELVA